MLQDFNAITFTDKDEKALAPFMSGWMRLYKFIEPMVDSPSNLKTLAQILAIELASGEPRKIVLTRIHMRFAAMRGRLEFNKLLYKAKR